MLNDYSVRNYSVQEITETLAKHDKTTVDKATTQIADIINYPVIVTWSDASTSESTLKNVFSNVESYKRYADYKKNGKPYPVRVDIEEPLEADKELDSSIFIGDTLESEYKLINALCERFNDELKRQYEMRGKNNG